MDSIRELPDGRRRIGANRTVAWVGRFVGAEDRFYASTKQPSGWVPATVNGDSRE
jgi:hypothetical protein